MAPSSHPGLFGEAAISLFIASGQACQTNSKGVGMRKLIMWNLVTLDGYFEGPKSWDIDWHNYAWGEELEQYSLAQSKSADLLLFGRVTYQGMASYWMTAKGEIAEIADFMNAIPKMVFSRTLEKAEWPNTRLVKENAAETVAQLKQQPGKDILIFGSANLSATLTQRGLIDEYRLGLTPVVLGSGTPLFKPGAGQLRLKLLEARPLKTGCVLLFYQPER
jgi:dihydrofolate reductase